MVEPKQTSKGKKIIGKKTLSTKLSMYARDEIYVYTLNSTWKHIECVLFAWSQLQLRTQYCKYKILLSATKVKSQSYHMPTSEYFLHKLSYIHYI